MRARTSQAAISRIERGLVSPSVAMLAQLLRPDGRGARARGTRDRLRPRSNTASREPRPQRVWTRIAPRNGVRQLRPPQPRCCPSLLTSVRSPSSARSSSTRSTSSSSAVLPEWLTAPRFPASTSTSPTVALDRIWSGSRRRFESSERRSAARRRTSRSCSTRRRSRPALNFTFSTPFGPLDILDRPAGAPPYEQLKAAATLAVIRRRARCESHRSTT